MDNFLAGACAGMIAGAVILGLAHDYDTHALGSQGNVFIKDCQTDLPRSQKCVLVAVPESEVDHVEKRITREV